MRSQSGFGLAMERFSHAAMIWTGSTAAFVIAVLLLVGWLVSGPLFHFSDTWQLVINTFTTVVTFLMVFLIQRAQNKDARAMELKLNELIASIDKASNRLIGVESLSEPELDALEERYRKLLSTVQRGKSSRRRGAARREHRDA